MFRIKDNILIDYLNDNQIPHRIVVPEGVTSIGIYAFSCHTFESSCERLVLHEDVEIILPKTLLNIDSYAFQECPIRNIVIPDTVDTIGRGAFVDSGISGRLQIPASVREIGEGAFAGCNGLESVLIKASNIRSKAFSCCPMLKDVYLLKDDQWENNYQTLPAFDAFLDSPVTLHITDDWGQMAEWAEKNGIRYTTV